MASRIEITSRFNSWEEIFPDSAEADRQYAALIEDLRKEYTVGGQLSRQEKVEVNPQTGLEATIFQHQQGYYSRIGRLPNGNIRYELGDYNQAVRSIDVVPQAGNKNHPWKYDEIIGLQAQAVIAMRELPVPEREILVPLLGYLEGKPASLGWEEKMIRTDYLPQRIGYKIYPEAILAAVTERLKIHK